MVLFRAASAGVAMQSDPPVVLIVDDDEDSLAMYAFGLLAMGF